MKKNTFRSLLLVLAFVVSLFAGVSDVLASPASAKAKGGNAYAKGKIEHETIQLVSINDFHGSVLETFSSGKPSNPGIAKVAGELDLLRKKYPTVFLSAGDNFQGSAISNLTQGEVVNEAFQLMNLRASAIGNHEYDWGYDLISKWSKDGKYPYLAANIVYKDSGEAVDYAIPYKIEKIKLKNGKVVQIGIIGIATPETATKTAYANVADIDFTDPVKATNKWSKYLREKKKVDAVVALTHLGGFQDRATGEVTGELKTYANNVKGVDLIFSGHTHQTIDAVVNGIQILQGYYNGRSLSVAELTFTRKKPALVKVDGYVDDLRAKAATLPINKKVKALVDAYEKELAPILNEVIGTNARALSHDTELGLTPMGQWTAKALAEIGKTQIAIVNGGGIREGLDAGNITMGHMYSIFPFDNTLVTLEVTGSKLYDLIEHGIDPADFRDGQFYGIKVTYDPTAPYGSRITAMTLVDGTPIDMTATYTVSTVDFLITGGDKYNFTGATNIVDTFIPVRDVLVDYIKAKGTLDHTFDASAYVAE